MNYLVIMAILFGSTAHATSWQVYRSNNKGAKKILEKSFYGAYQDLNTALADDPLNPVVQLNLGLAFEANEENAKAEQAYLAAAALNKEDQGINFVANFNTGVVRGKAKNVDGALAAYQDALEHNPNSLEAKTNIELLIQGGGGGGEGENKDEKKDKNQGQGQDQKDQQRGGEPQQQQQQKQQPKPFDSKELTPADVKKILDEIKNQEQAIRAQDYQKGPKESPRGGKDW